jgi:hypothetical protein
LPVAYSGAVSSPQCSCIVAWCMLKIVNLGDKRGDNGRK